MLFTRLVREYIFVCRQAEPLQKHLVNQRIQCAHGYLDELLIDFYVWILLFFLYFRYQFFDFDSISLKNNILDEAYKPFSR